MVSCLPKSATAHLADGLDHAAQAEAVVAVGVSDEQGAHAGRVQWCPTPPHLRHMRDTARWSRGLLTHAKGVQPTHGRSAEVACMHMGCACSGSREAGAEAPMPGEPPRQTDLVARALPGINHVHIVIMLDCRRVNENDKQAVTAPSWHGGRADRQWRAPPAAAHESLNKCPGMHWPAVGAVPDKPTPHLQWR